MFGGFGKEKMSKEMAQSQEVVFALKVKITNETLNAFLESRDLDKDFLKKEILNNLPTIDAVMLDVRLDEYIKNMKEEFAGFEIMKDLIRDNEGQKNKMIEDINQSTEFLLKDF